MLSLYFHIPFCNHKCFYCDFYSFGKFNKSQEDLFIESLIKEIEIASKTYYKGNEIDTVFFGGGTPSVLEEANFDIICESIKKHFNFSENYEWTMECNPESLNSKKLDNYLKNGVNRISLGAQSFDNNELKFLERIHSKDQIIEKFKLARNAGFKNISLDLIFSLPKQKKDIWLESLYQAIDLNPNHISAYSLIFEEKTKLFNHFEKGEILPNDPDFEHDLYLETIDILEKNGLKQYEISNFANENYECRHNMNYWYGAEYLSFGPSAHSYLNNRRFWNFRSLNKYNLALSNNELPEESFEIIDNYKEITERIYLNLRAKGIDNHKFKEKYSIDLMNLINTKAKYLVNEFLYINNDFISLSKKGYSMADDISLKIIELTEL